MVGIRYFLSVIAFSVCLLLGSSAMLPAQWHFPVIPGPLPNAASSLGGDCIRLTPRANNVRGVVWDSNQVDLTQPFDLSISTRMSPASKGIGEGAMAIVLQRAGLQAAGAGGNGMGYADAVPPDPFYSGITPSIAFEIDIWSYMDFTSFHVGIHRDGRSVPIVIDPIVINPATEWINDGVCRTFRVVWTPSTNNVKVYFPDALTLRIDATIDMVNTIFSGNTNVWWGMTASSGNPAQGQDVCVGAQFANAGVDTFTCAGQPIQLQASGGITYLWDQGFPVISDRNIPNPFATSPLPGPVSLGVLVTNAAGCQDRDTVIVFHAAPPSADPGPGGTVCIGDSIQLGGIPNGNYAYSWSPAAGLNDTTAPQPWFTPTTPGSHAFQMIVEDTAGFPSCRDTATVTVLVSAPPSVDVTALFNPICSGTTTELSANASGGSGSYTYLWSPGGATTPVDTVAPSDTTTYSVTVTDTTCAVSDSLVLLVYPPSSIDITLPDTTVCGGGSIAITNTYGSPGVNTWTWDPPLGVSNPLDPNPVITPVGTTYYLTGSDPYGCEHTDSIKIGVVNFNLSIWQDSTICLGDSLVLGLQIPGGSGGGYTVQWWDPSGGFISDPFIRNPMVLPRVTTTYTATVTDTASGCQETISTDVTVIILQIQASPGSITINPGQSVQMQATGGVRYLWDPDTTINCIVCPDPVAAPGNSTLYTVTGWDIHGCTATATVNIATDSLLVPNVFTPNGDGVNDVLLFNYHGSAFYQISIYDRWGKMIYSTTDRNAMWDGRTSAGGDAPESVYYVAVRIVGDAAIPDKDKQKVFPVTLIR